ncbi:MgtC/SapB family protein [Vaginella massiliensis]|uniref:MgtC/SapB family protein n=1 Tax=Vaginella massiliensis TaxID=1816680 RepID=UPI0008391499|nr:MgtC/SapB family protein [Vaginella massiliensis]
MGWDTIDWNWDTIDIFKALLSLILGLLLGLERELKDKAAGLRTITIISLGSTLFTIMSYKLGIVTTGETTRIASYVVSGIGFLGAGVIFKDGISINGLTTASIIWIAAAIGMSVGFGHFATAIVFFFATFVTIHIGKWFNKTLHSQSIQRTLELKFENKRKLQEELIEEIANFSESSYIKQRIKNDDMIVLFIDVKIKTIHQKKFMDYLLRNDRIEYFKF